MCCNVSVTELIQQGIQQQEETADGIVVRQRAGMQPAVGAVGAQLPAAADPHAERTSPHQGQPLFRSVSLYCFFNINNWL